MLINYKLYLGIHQEFYIWFWEEGEENPGEKVGWNGGRTKSKIFYYFYYNYRTSTYKASIISFYF